MQTKKTIIDQYRSCLINTCSVIWLLCFSFVINAQDSTFRKDIEVPVMDVGDFARKIFNKKEDTTKPRKSTTILPSIGYNPSFGFVIGAKISAIKQFGKPENTNLSSFGLEAIYSTKGIVTAQFRHNMFTDANKWNLQGNWQISKFVIEDYGIGTGNKELYKYRGDSTFLIRFRFIRLTEKIYRKIGPKIYAGGGISFDIRSNINDQQLEVVPSTPHQRYSVRNEIDPKKYSANGFLFAFQYNTREHPLRSYGGEYFDFNLRFNQKFIGSTKNSIQLFYDLRKYIGLSKKNPEHILAFWHWASYRLSGTVPYLELPILTAGAVVLIQWDDLKVRLMHALKQNIATRSRKINW